MGKGNKGNDRGRERKRKVPMTNEEKAEYFTRSMSEEIIGRIEKGEVAIAPTKKCIKKQSKGYEINANMPLESIEQSLRSLRANIRQQKQEQKEYERMKLFKAQELIVKMKKQKEEQKRKIVEKEEKSILHSRIFSESTLTKMRQKLEERVENKRKEIQERIRGIAARKNERDQRMVEQQIQYWERMKHLQEKNQSTHNLPLLNPETLVKRKSASLIPIKNSMGQNIQTQHSTEPYSKKKDFYLEKMKMKEESMNVKLTQRKNIERLNKIIASNKDLAEALSQNNPSHNQFLPSHFHQKSKLYGDEYLKESLLQIKKKAPSPASPSLSLQSEHKSLQESIQLKAREAHLQKNQNVEKLRQKWARVLSRVQHKEVAEEQGLELLNSIQRRLDKVDLVGMSDRLRKKAQVFSRQKFQSAQRSFQQPMEPPTPSFECKD